MQLFSPFCRSYQIEVGIFRRSNRNHGPGSLCCTAFPSSSCWLAYSSFSIDFSPRVETVDNEQKRHHT